MGLTWSDIAASAYWAYAVSTGNTNFRGDPMPAWDDLPQTIRTAWEEACRQVGKCLNRSAVGGEDRWAGWTPPKPSGPASTSLW